MEGFNPRNSAVRQWIIRVFDQLNADEIRLVDCTPEEVEEARARVDAHLAKGDERKAHEKGDTA
jgi:hypothetical protein